MSIEEMYPEANKLTKDKEGNYVAFIVDEELDPIEVEFHFDRCVHIKTKDYTFLTLSPENLDTLKRLIFEAEKLFEEDFAEE